MKFLPASFVLLAVMSLIAPAHADHTQNAHPQRLVTLGGIVTETVFALGLGGQIVAVDTSSIWPPQAKELPQVGYFRDLSAEGILSAAPDLVLASAHAGPPAVLEKLRAAGVPIVTLPAPPPLDAALEMITLTARTIGREAQGQQLVDNIRQQIDRLPEPAQTPPRTLVVIGGQGGQWMAAGRGTAAGALVAMAGGRNIADTFPGYRPLGDEAILNLAPDVIVVPEHALPMLGGRQGILERPGVAATPAGRAHRLVVMDGLMLLGMGPRVAQAAGVLSDAFHTPAHDAIP